MSDTASSQRRVARSGAFLSALTLVSRLAGLARESVKAALLGTSSLSDAFTVAFMIPNFLRRLFAEGSITVAFIPTFKAYLLRGDKEETRDFLRATITVLTFCVTLMVVAGILASPWICRLFGSDLEETVLLTQIMFPFLALVSVAAFFQGILNGVDVYGPAGVAPILWNLIVIACAYALAPVAGDPARAMAWGVIVGGAVQAAIQFPYVAKRGFATALCGLRKALRNPGMRKVLALISPTILGMAAYQLNDLVCTSLASGAGTGVASSIQFSLRLLELILGVFAVSLGTVSLPTLSGHAARGEWGAFSAQLSQVMRFIVLVTVPVTAFSILCQRDMIVLLFKGAAFDEASVALTCSAFSWHILGLVFIALNRVVAPAFYAQGDTRSPTVAGMACFAVNIALAFALTGPLKGAGLAISLSASSLLNTAILVWLLRRNRNVDFGATVGRTGKYALRVALYTVISMVPAWFVHEVLVRIFADRGRLVGAGLPLLGTFLAFMLAGALCLLVAKDETASSMISHFIRPRGKKK